MTEAQTGMGFRAQIKEALSKEPVALVPVTEHNIPKFDAVLTNLNTLAMANDGMVPVTGDPNESNETWLGSVKSLWLFGTPNANFSVPEHVEGFVNVYAPEHMDEINEWLVQKKLRPYDEGSVVEFASFGLHSAASPEAEMSAVRQALAKVFDFDQEQYGTVRAVSVWATHNSENKLDPQEMAAIRALGGKPLGAARYSPNETVDSTCFMIPRKAFNDALLQPRQTLSPVQ